MADPIASEPPASSLRITWLGHSTLAIELDGVSVLTDPMLRARVAHLERVAELPQLDAFAAPDVVLLSHVHRDHLDRGSLRLLSRAAELVVPRGAAQLVAPLGFERVCEVAAGEEVGVRGLRIRVTHAEHPPGRNLLATGPQPVGFLLHDSCVVYFAGDTDVFAGMTELRPDVALLPVSGWGPRVPAGHLDADRAVEALELLAPRVAVPIHWGTYRPVYRRTPYESDAAAPERFAALARTRTPSVEVRVLQPGETWTAPPEFGA